MGKARSITVLETPARGIGAVVQSDASPKEALKFLLVRFRGKGDWRVYDVNLAKGRLRYLHTLFIFAGLAHQKTSDAAWPSAQEGSPSTVLLRLSDPLYGGIVKTYFDVKTQEGTGEAEGGRAAPKKKVARKYKGLPRELRSAARSL